MTHRGRAPHYRQVFRCVGCHLALAYLRPEWLIARRLLLTDQVASHVKIAGGVRLTCECGCVTDVTWAAIQF